MKNRIYLNEEIFMESVKSIGFGERKILTAIIQHDGMTREHLTVLTGYKRSSRDTFLQRLQARGYVQNVNGKMVATDEGMEEIGVYEPLPVGADLRDHLMKTLSTGEKRVLEILINSYPEAVDREKISEETNYKRSSRDTFLQRLGARQLVDVEGSGFVKASDKLF